MLRLMMSPASVLVVMLAVALVAAGFAARTWLRDRPPRRSTARQRLLRRNPWLVEAVDASRWSRRSNYVRLGWLTALVVSVAVLVVADRPAQPATASGAVDDVG